MPSDDRSRAALAALAWPREVFRSTVVAAVDELRRYLDDQRAPAGVRVEQEASRLGAFGAGRIDAGAFAAFTTPAAPMDPVRIERLEQAFVLLTSFVERGDSLFHARVPRGGDLRNAVRGELAARGSLFRTAHEIEMLRAGESLGAPVGDGSLQFRHWRRAEREMAPPLVVHVDGPDVFAPGLAEFMDGTQKIVLVVDGPAPAAPLARLIAPRTFVMQTSDPADLAKLGAYAGAGVAALLPDGCARFVHDPSRGASLAQRLTVEFLPAVPTRAVAGGSLRQQAEDIAWLTELSRLSPVSSVVAAETAAPAAVAPADQLAAWLLRMSAEPAGS